MWRNLIFRQSEIEGCSQRILGNISSLSDLKNAVTGQALNGQAAVIFSIMLLLVCSYDKRNDTYRIVHSMHASYEEVTMTTYSMQNTC